VTQAQLNALSFGYLTGADLSQYCNAQILLNQYAIDSTSLQTACTIAQGIVTSTFASKYDMTTEYALTTGRDTIVVMCTAIKAIEVLCANLPGIGEHTQRQIDMGKQTLEAVRNGQMSLISVQLKATDGTPEVSGGNLIDQSFSTIG
jgi:hypothetical protein